MRRGNNPKRSRGGRPNNRKGPQGNRSIESHSPGGGKQRGNASQLYERYSNLARDAQSSGDRVAYEGYLQYAEHYLRVINAAQESRGNGRAPGNGQEARPQEAQAQDAPAQGSQTQVKQDGSRGNGGGNGRDGVDQPEPTLGEASGPVPEMLETPADLAGEGDSTGEDLDNDPLEGGSAVN